MSAAERLGRQTLPLVLIGVGAGLLLSFLKWPRSAFMIPYAALVFCGFLAPTIQMITTVILSEKRIKKSAIILDGIIICISWVAFFFGEPISEHIPIPQLKYHADLGITVNATIALLASITVCIVAYLPQPSTARKKESADDLVDMKVGTVEGCLK